MSEPALECPKCHGTMRNLELGGTPVEECPKCGGLFLDRPGLERLLTAGGTGAPPYQGKHRRGKPITDILSGQTYT